MRLDVAQRRATRVPPFLAAAFLCLAAVRAVAAGQPPGPARGLSWPEVLEHFRQLAPADRQRLVTRADLAALPTQRATRGILTMNIVERGSLEPVHGGDVVCRLRDRGKDRVASTIKWVIDNGTFVKKGDKVVELDDSGLREELRARALELEQARAAHVKAQESLKRVQTENEIDVRLAEVALRLAEVRLNRAGAADREQKEELQLKVEQARLGLRRVQAQARGREGEAEAELRAKAAVVEFAKARTSEVEADLGKCVLRAPQDGLAVYYVPESVRGGAGTQQAIVAVGEPVREGQKLLQVPDPSQMQVNVRVHEAYVALLRDADPRRRREPQRALIRVDAFPNRAIGGHVKAVDTVASQQDWFATDVKVYKTVVALDTPVEGLRPGMSAEVRIVAQLTAEPVVQVPLQAVVAVGRKRFCFVSAGKDVQAREVVPGRASDAFMEVRSGLNEGDEVLLAPRAVLRRLSSFLENPDRPGGGNRQSRRSVPPPILVRAVKPSGDAAPRRAWVSAYGLTYRDLERIATLPNVVEAVPVRTFPYEAQHLHRADAAQVVATTPAFAEVNGLTLSEGRFLMEEDSRELRNVAVLGAAVAEGLFPGEQPVGAAVLVRNNLYEVVGVVGEQGQAVNGQPAAQLNHAVYLPLRTCQARFGERVIVRRGGSRTGEQVPLHAIQVVVRDARQVVGTFTSLSELLEQAHPNNDWAVERPAGF